MRRRRPLLAAISVAGALLLAALTSWAVRAQNSSPAPPLQGGVESDQGEILSPQYKLGRELYIKNCGYCHIAIPPEVFPDATWRELLLNSYHYGREVKLDFAPEKLLVWQYLRDYSRGLEKDEATPYYFRESRYFRALHPKVPLPKEIKAASCSQCHPGARDFSFIRLSAEWNNRP
ncbi:hypothetical protein [Gloeobacter kilaueensis]|uniref:Diheme cytochrome c n=1 Tax=Gloeobacter kilaueensis (strain ATCC BAA-2537 / CCAP 1431/1 / ULC 316 / JS1) TaxID=1183438 RepID=U5QQ10_GLOK1|nr:hypothetical protein [Gloeobacter kilaueensis]AGY59780.1 hypothetical protein GKIL_3534 [Gloeobacter kilaueensis JS1]